MKIAITGGTGFVGKALTNFLLNEGHEIYILTRHQQKSTQKNLTFIPWLGNHPLPIKQLDGIDAIVNLAGQTINARWTNSMKEKIISSRMKATETVINLIQSVSKKPKVFINATAIGYYGTSLHQTFDETDITPGHDFLANVVVEWEQVAKKAENLNVRTVLSRFGVILHKSEGALPKMVLPYQLLIGGPIGSGKQWLSWIHLDDVVRMIDFAIQNECISGPMNVTSPNPKQNNDFGKELAKVLHRPHYLPVPSFMLRLLLGEMSMLVLEGQRVLPKIALENGFTFTYPELKDALEDIFK